MKQYQFLLLDADNTLFDFNAAEDYAITKTLSRFGAPVSLEAKRAYKAGNKALWEAFERGEISQDDLTFLRFDILMEVLGIQGDPHAWNEYYIMALSQCTVLIPGAEQLCYRLSAKYTLALTTNGLAQVQRRRLERSPIARYFGKNVFISGEMGVRKPEKQYFELVLEAIGARTHRNQVLVIGDSLTSDIRGAFNARLDCVWFNRTDASPGVLTPTYQVHNLVQLSRLLTALPSPI